MSRTAFISLCVLAHGVQDTRSVAVPNCHSPFSRPGWSARGGRRGCAGCLWARERYAMSALRLFHITSKAKLKKNRAVATAMSAGCRLRLSPRWRRGLVPRRPALPPVGPRRLAAAVLHNVTPGGRPDSGPGPSRRAAGAASSPIFAGGERGLWFTRTGSHFVSLPRSCHKIKAVMPPPHTLRAHRQNTLSLTD